MKQSARRANYLTEKSARRRWQGEDLAHSSTLKMEDVHPI
jgi:hypothetical protein